MSGAAPDGSPIELYARMTTLGESELVHAAIPAGTELLELGHPVIAVDHSAEMLAHVRGAETVRADIEELDVGRRFGCVLLASQLVNVDDDRQRAAFLEACARHVAPDGAVVVQRYDPEWAADPQPSNAVREGVRVRVIDPRRDGERLTATVEYEIDGQTWRHGPFTSRILDDDELDACLRDAGLARERWLDERRAWLVARPATGRPAAPRTIGDDA